MVAGVLSMTAASVGLAPVHAETNSGAVGGSGRSEGAPLSSLTVVEDAVPDGPQDFGFTGCLGSGCAPFSLDDDADPSLPASVTSSSLGAGTYTITQAPTAGWALVDIFCTGNATVDLGTRTATVTLTAGASATCTFLNRAPSITIVEDMDPNSGHDMGFTSCLGSGCGTFSLDDDAEPTLSNSVTGVPLVAGTYTVTQSPDAAWPLTSLSCSTGESVDLANRKVTITLAPTESTVCTFTNKSQSITVVQDTVPDGPQDVGFTGCQGTGCGPFSLDDDADGTLPRFVTSTGLTPGTYTVTQGAAPGLALTGLVCDTGEVVSLADRRATITLTAGENVTCTFTNQPAAPLAGISQIASGDRQTCAVLAGGQVRCWGNNTGRAIGDGTSTTRLFPVAVSDPAGTGPLTQVTQVDTAGATNLGGTYARSCARLDDGQARCWGGNALVSPPIGDGTSNVGGPRPVVIANETNSGPLSGVAEISASGSFTCARLSAQVRCWGRNSSGRLGDGTGTDRSLPTAVRDVDNAGPLVGVTQISVGSDHACARLGNGEVRCWGENSQGQLGSGSETPSSLPVVVSNPDGTGPLTDVVQVAAGESTTCATLTNGEARCWGTYTGSGTSAERTRPVPVLDTTGSAPLTGVAQVSVGGTVGNVPTSAQLRDTTTACALLTNGEARCWGNNDYGQIGDGTTVIRVRPVAVSDPGGTGPLTGVVALTVGGFNTCALLNSGEARCWGIYPGDGTSSSVRPVAVLNLGV